MWQHVTQFHVTHVQWQALFGFNGVQLYDLMIQCLIWLKSHSNNNLFMGVVPLTVARLCRRTFHPLDLITHSILRQKENMATPSDLIAPASDCVYVYRGRCDAPARRGCTK